MSVSPGHGAKQAMAEQRLGENWEHGPATLSRNLPEQEIQSPEDAYTIVQVCDLGLLAIYQPV